MEFDVYIFQQERCLQPLVYLDENTISSIVSRYFNLLKTRARFQLGLLSISDGDGDGEGMEMHKNGNRKSHLQSLSING